MNDQQDLIREFLIESYENLARLDEEIVDLERRPSDQALLAGVFRTIHTIKGTCGCLGFRRLEALTHLGENLLGQVRSGERELTHSLVSLLLEMADAVKRILATIERTGGEGRDSPTGLCARLDAALHGEPGTAPAPSPEAPAPVHEPEPGPDRLVGPLPVNRPVVNQGPRAPAADPVHCLAGTPACEAEDVFAAKGSVAGSTIRVDIGLLDHLMNLVGELALARNQFFQLAGVREDAAFSAACHSLDRITTRLRESVRETRVQPIRAVWNLLPRVVRGLAAACGKRISLDMEGAGIEIDRSILEAIKAPLIHIVRNGCDHGIENPDFRRRAGKPPTGRIFLRAVHEDGHLTIEITDDGAGVDNEKVRACAVQRGLLSQDQADLLTGPDLVRLLFRPGFSTAGEITGISGRGVGMDVVKTSIERIGGVVDLFSRKGAGTTVRIKIPLPPAAVIPGLLGAAAGEPLVLPRATLDGAGLRGRDSHPPG